MSKLSKKPSARRKFSFELPRLKIGPSKSDGRSSKDEGGATGQDSPTPTPKSVRPPLSPNIDHQLRRACAYVLQDFKPSHQLYGEQYGKDPGAKRQPGDFKPYHQLRKEWYGKSQDREPQSSEPATKPSTEKDIEQTEAHIISEPSARAQPEQWDIDQREIEQLTLGIPKMKPTIKSQAFFEGLHLDPPTLNARAQSEREETDQDDEINVDLSNFNPPIASQAIFEGVDLDRIRKATAAAIQEPMPPLRSPEIAVQKFRTPLKRSLSNPAHSRTPSADQPNTAPRAESVETTTSTPPTEGTEHSRKPSTAPTSTAITPAISSLRTSSQAAGPSSEKFLTADIEWMRLELENHKRAEDEARAQQELENQVLSSIGLETMPAHSKQSSNSSAHVLQRKPVSCSSTGSQRAKALEQTGRTRRKQGSIQERRNVPPVPQLDSRQSRELARSESRRQRSTPRSESAQELEMLRPESRQSRRSRMSEDREPSNRRSISRDIKDYFKRPSSEKRPTSPSSEMSRASSRSRRLFQVHGQPSDGMRTPPASLEGSKPESRSRSIESSRVAVSAVASSIDSAANKLRSWKSYRTPDDSASFEFAESSTHLTKRHSRDLSREFQQSSDHHRTSKPSVNLNRKLPPLPALDQWKPIESEKPKHISAMVSPRIGNFSRKSEAASMSEPNLLERQAEVSPRIGSATASTSRIQSIYSRYSKLPENWTLDDAPPYTPVPTDADFPHSATHERFDFRDSTNDLDPLPGPPALTVEAGQQRIPSEYMFRANLGKVTSPMIPPPIPFELKIEPKTTRRRTEDMFLPDLDARARTASKDNTANDTTDTTKQSHVVNYSRSMRKQPTVLRKQNLVRTQTQISAPINNDRPISHTKAASEQINFSRKPSTDNYSRLYDMGYRNIVQIQPTQAIDIQQLSAPARSSSKKWWKRGTSKREKDDVSNSGSQPSLAMMDENAVAQF